MQPTSADREDIHLHATSAGQDAAGLRRGADVVLDMPLRHGLLVADGVLIDDHLDHDARQAVDELALGALDAWHRGHDKSLRFGSFSIGDIWHTELFAEVFLPVARTITGVRAALEAAGASRVVTYGLDPELHGALENALSPVVLTVGEPGLIQRYPSEDAAPKAPKERAPRWQRLARASLDAVGLPSFAGGDVLIVSYYSTLPVFERLAAGHGPRPVVYGAFPPPLGLAVRAMRRGGWTGLPGWRGHGRATVDLENRLGKLRASAPPEMMGPGLDELLHRRALRCLTDRAGPSLALGRLLEQELDRGRIRAVILPFDSEPIAKVLVRSAEARHIPVLTLQHGYEPRKTFHAGEVSDALGAWSRWDLESLPAERQARTRVVGNPGRGTVDREDRSEPLHVVILVEHALRTTAAIDRRVTARHLGVALEGLRQTGAPWRITIRPHPADDVDAFRELASQLNAESVAIDAETPILDLMRAAQVCIGAISTATLQTVLTQTRVVMLMPERIDCVPPLDGSTDVLFATTATELAAALDVALRSDGLPGADALREALGHGPADPIETSLSWLRELAGSPGHNAL